MPRFALALLSAGAAAIHFAVIDEHLDEYWLFGVFFTAVAVAQTAWAMLVLTRPTRWLLLAGAAGNLIVMIVWAISRTMGVPIGPEAGTAEPIGLEDAVSNAYEALIVIGTLPLLWHKMAGRRLVPHAGVPLRLLAITIIPLTGYAVFYVFMC